MWLNYADEIKEKTPRIHNYLKTHEPELLDDYTVRIKLDNQSQEAAFRDIVYDGLTKALKSSLRNYSIELEIGVDITQKAKLQSYNKTDILNHLLNKNTEFEKLKEKFDLDFE